MIKILISGGDSKLAYFLMPYLKNNISKILLLNKSKLDITDFKTLNKVISDFKPTFFLNLSSSNNVDLIEYNPLNALATNGHALEALSETCNKNNVCLIHFSTNYVFDGIQGFYDEMSDTNPISFYGKSKLLGESFINKILKSFYIIRTSNLCSLKTQNILTNMISHIKSNDQINAVDDFYISLTKYDDLAYMVFEIIKRHNSNLKVDYGTYHFSSFFPISYYDFSKYLVNRFFPNKNIKVIPIKHSEYKGLNFNIRPRKAFLISDKINSALNIKKLKTRKVVEYDYSETK